MSLEKPQTAPTVPVESLDALYDARYAQGYMEDYWDRNTYKRLHEVISSLGLPPQGRALDFGCGQGILTVVLQDALPGWEICGTDLSDVAISIGRQRHKDISFFLFDDLKDAGETFDFIFTHHVLEHVDDLDAALDLIGRYLKPGGSILHVLPCGNPGSFEHDLASSMIDGIDSSRGNRFYFEEPGHLRRLTTTDLQSRYAARHMHLAHAFYYNHQVAAIENFTRSWRFFLDLTDPTKARTDQHRAQLSKLRMRYVPLGIIRVAANKFERTRRKPSKSPLDWALLAVGTPVYPVAKAVDRNWRNKTWDEWTQRKLDPAGGGMFLHFASDR